MYPKSSSKSFDGFIVFVPRFTKRSMSDAVNIYIYIYLFIYLCWPYGWLDVIDRQADR